MNQRKVVFSPGCFDHFDGTQEELDELLSCIKDMFENMSDEELKKIASPIEEMPEELIQHIEAAEKRQLQ